MDCAQQMCLMICALQIDSLVHVVVQYYLLDIYFAYVASFAIIRVEDWIALEVYLLFRTFVTP